MTARPPSRKYRKRERRRAARHGMTVLEWRAHKAERIRQPARANRTADPADDWATWRQDAT